MREESPEQREARQLEEARVTAGVTDAEWRYFLKLVKLMKKRDEKLERLRRGY